jgi:hypothetical protein
MRNMHIRLLFCYNGCCVVFYTVAKSADTTPNHQVQLLCAATDVWGIVAVAAVAPTTIFALSICKSFIGAILVDNNRRNPLCSSSTHNEDKHGQLKQEEKHNFVSCN